MDNIPSQVLQLLSVLMSLIHCIVTMAKHLNICMSKFLIKSWHTTVKLNFGTKNLDMLAVYKILSYFKRDTKRGCKGFSRETFRGISRETSAGIVRGNRRSHALYIGACLVDQINTYSLKLNHCYYHSKS